MQVLQEQPLKLAQHRPASLGTDLLPLLCWRVLGLSLDGEQLANALNEPANGMLGAIGLW